MSMKTNSLSHHRQLENSPSANVLGSRSTALGSPYLGGGKPGVTMKASCFGAGKQPTKEDLVLEKAGVGDRKLALELDRLDKETKAHMKIREREEKAMRQVSRDIRKHRVFDDSSIGRQTDGIGGGNRLLPPIMTPEGSPKNIRRVRSTPNSPTSKRKAQHIACHSRISASPSPRRGTLGVHDFDGDDLGLRVRSAGPGLSPVVLQYRSRSTSNLPSSAGASSPTYGTPAIAVYTSKDGGKQQSNPDISSTSIHVPHSPNTPNTNKQRPWERGLTPARRARTPSELAKVQGSVSFTAPSADHKNGSRLHKSDSNLTTIEKSSDDPRFQKLTSCLVRNDDSCTISSSDESQEERDSSRSADALSQEMVAIRITSSTPTLPSSLQRDLHHHPAPSMLGHLQEPGLPLPPLKAHHPRSLPSPRILVNTTVSSACGQGEVISEDTVELSRDSHGCCSSSSGAAHHKDLISLDTDRLKPMDITEETIHSPPFHTKTHTPEW